MGGSDTINLGAAGHTDDVWIGVYHEGGVGGTNFVQAITDIVGGGEIGANFYLGALHAITTVTGFTLGAGGDILTFSPSSWAHAALAVGFDFGLETNTGLFFSAVPHDASLELVAAPGFITTGADVTLDHIGNYANAAALQTALTTLGVGDINFGNYAFPTNSIDHHLVAYNTGSGVNIADVELSTGGASFNTDTASGIGVTVHDLVTLVGATDVAGMVPANIHFIA